jgi:hypothetical protein
VLPLLTDRLQIVLTPERVTIIRQGARFKSAVTSSKSSVCAAAEQGEHTWQPALRALQQLLLEAKYSAAKVTVTLSNHFVRYQVINAQPDLTSAEEEQAFVRFSFSEVYGAEANNWALRWGNDLSLAPQVASAIDQALLDQLEAIITDAGLTLSSVQPYLMAAFNHVRNLIHDKPHWFVLVEPGIACVSFMRNGDWQLLHSARLGGDWAADLPRVLGREFQQIGLVGERGQMTVCLPGYLDPKRLAPENHSVRLLTMTPEMLVQGAVKSMVIGVRA